MKKILFATFAMALFMAGCYKYEPQFEGPYEDSNVPAINQVVYEILTVEDGRIHLYDRNLQNTKVLTNLPQGISKASINFSHDRMAYQIPGQDIAIIDSAGLALGTVSNSAAAKWFDWHTNNRSLFLLENYKLRVWGDPLSLSTTNLGSVFPLGASDLEMNSVSVLEDGTIVAPYSDYGGFSVGYESKVAIIPPTGTRTYLNRFVYVHNTWMRANLNGHALYDVTAGGGDPEFWFLEVSVQNQGQIGFGDYGSVSPAGDRIASWGNGFLEVYQSSTTTNRSFSTGNAVITALDW